MGIAPNKLCRFQFLDEADKSAKATVTGSLESDRSLKTAWHLKASLIQQCTGQGAVT